jgi:Na+/melibiose symporter-like transporter
MIITCKKEIPLRWIAFAILPWASFSFNYGVISVVFFFSLKKFIENPAGLTFILSLPGFVSIVLQPVVSFLSDRIWTRFGRRKPFIATSMSGIIVCLILMPLMPNFWALLAVFMAYNAFADLNSPMEPLKQEIIPPHERGRATGAMSWCSNLATLLFYFLALGRFDDVHDIAGYPLHGETVIYWSAALLVVVMLMLLTLGIKEIDQKSALRGQRLSFRTVAGGLLDRELFPVYLLVIGATCLNFYSGLGALSNLLYTDQWGYTKQEMGINVAIGGIINLFAIGVLTVFADRFNRMRTYQVLICVSLSCQVLYYSYINFVLPDHRPTLVEIIVFGETISILGILTGLVYTPLVYDYVRRNKMGTFNAGTSLVAKITIVFTLNGVGLFVWGYAMLFQPPAGDMTRVVLRGDRNEQSEINAVLHAGHWTYPKDNLPAPDSAVSATAWQADGTVAKTGRAWEIRLRDPDSEKLAAQKQALETEESPLAADEKMLRDRVSILQLKGQAADASGVQRSADADGVRVKKLDGEISALGAQLTARAENFHSQVVRALGDRILGEGEQVTGGTVNQALLLQLTANHRPDPRQLEKVLANLRREFPTIIDLRPLKIDRGYGVEVSALVPSTADRAAFEHELQAEVEAAAAPVDHDLFTSGTAPLGRSVQTALTLDLLVVENPIPTYVSPITRVVNGVLGLFHDAPDPHRRLTAIARNLRIPTDTNHVRVEPGPGARTLSVTVVLPAAGAQAVPTTTDDALTARLTSLLGNQGATPAVVQQARLVYDRIQSAAADQRITVARPTLISGYANMRYDYMSGYLWMFIMGSLGIGLTFAFARLEARGFIHKRGLEESRNS